jgi:hypothetical protein
VRNFDQNLIAGNWIDGRVLDDSHATVAPSVLATVDGNIANVRGFAGKLIKNSEFRTASEPDVAYQSKSESLDESPVCVLIRITPKCFRSHLRLR